MKNRNMFEAYDTGCQPSKPEVYRPEHRVIGSANVKLIHDLKGREIGVRVKEGSAFTLYFTFDGDVENDTLCNLLSEGIFGFEVRNQRHQTVLVAPVAIYPDGCMASVDLVSEVDGTLCYGNYYLYLYMILDGISYTLFSERDAVLSID